MKKSKVLKHLPNVPALKKRETELVKQVPKLQVELQDTQEILAALKDVTLHNEYPVKVTALADGHEVTSGCDEGTRSAFVKPATSGGKFVVTTSLSNSDEGMPVAGEHKKADAFRIAKDFVSTGKKEAASGESVKRGRGRPKKV